MDMQGTLYAGKISASEARQASEALVKKIKNLQWEKRNYEIRDPENNDCIEAVENELAYACALLALYEKGILYPEVTREQVDVLKSYYDLQHLFLPETLKLMPEEVRAAHKEALALGLFSELLVFCHEGGREHILLGRRQNKNEKPFLFLIARWHAPFSPPSPWEDMVAHYVVVKDAKKTIDPVTVLLTAGIVIGLSAVFLSSYFMPISVALGIGAAMAFGAWGCLFIWHYYVRKLRFLKAVHAPF